MSTILDTDLLVINRGDTTYKVSAAELELSTDNINPNPATDISFNPAVTGSGTFADPWVLSPIDVSFGQSGISVEQIIFSNQTTGELVVFEDENQQTNGARFSQTVGTIYSDGTYTTNIRFVDTPISTETKTYTARLRLKETNIYFLFDVNVAPQGESPVINNVTLSETGDSSSRFDNQTFNTTVTMANEGVPVAEKQYSYKVEGTFAIDLETSVITNVNENGGEVELTFTDDKDLSDLVNGIVLTQNSGQTISTSAIQTVSEAAGEWTLATGSGQTYYWFDITYGNGRYVTSGESSFLGWSDDGIVWTPVRTAGSTSVDYRGVTYGNGKYVAVAYSGNTSVDSKVAYSTDGKSWTLHAGANNNNWWDVCYGGGKFVAIAAGGSDSQYGMYSTNGTTWSGCDLTSSKQWKGITYGNGKFIAVASNGGTQSVAYSTDGIIWNYANASGLAKWNSVAFGNGTFVAVGEQSTTNTVMYSSNGTTWGAATTPNFVPGSGDPTGWQSVTFDAFNGKFIAVARYGSFNNVMYSFNGSTWFLGADAPQSSWYGIATNDSGRAVACAASTSQTLVYSDNGGAPGLTTLTFNNDTNLANFRVNDTIDKGIVEAIDIPSREMEVTLAGSSTYSPGQVVQSSTFLNAATGTITNIDVGAKQVTLNPTTNRWLMTEPDWEAGKKPNKTAKATRVLDNATLYLETNSFREVTGTSSAPVYYEKSENTDTITFNQPTGTGKTWDEEFPELTTITACVEAVNATGTDSKCSNVVQPEVVLNISDLFSTTIWYGTGGDVAVPTGIDNTDKSLIWIKSMELDASHHIVDSLRRSTGDGVYDYISSNTITQEQNAISKGVSELTSTGIEFKGSDVEYNFNNSNFAIWDFRAAPGFFDIVSYTGTGAAGRQIPHDLGSTPGMVIVKRLNGDDNWTVQHQSLGGTKSLYLNQTSGQDTSGTEWNNTAATSTDFIVGTSGKTNGNSDSYIAYLFAADTPGFIKCGEYAGTGASGNFVNCGFAPQWLLIKEYTSTGRNWHILDTTRGMTSDILNRLYADEQLPTDPISGGGVEPMATGFEITLSGDDINGSGKDYMYIAIAQPVVNYMTQEQVNAMKLLVKTQEFRAAQYRQDLVARAAELRTTLIEQGYSTADIDSMLN